MFAQSGDLQDDVEIIHECDTTWHFGYKGISLYSRPMHRIDTLSMPTAMPSA